jgi:CrcB protein
MLNCIAVGFGGFLGAICRYLCNLIPQGSVSFPVTTMIINFTGALLIGVFSALPAALGLPVDPRLNLFLTTGLCGGFTTFSTFSLETVKLFDNGKFIMGIGYALLSVTCCLVAIYCGRLIMKLFT